MFIRPGSAACVTSGDNVMMLANQHPILSEDLICYYVPTWYYNNYNSIRPKAVL